MYYKVQKYVIVSYVKEYSYRKLVKFPILDVCFCSKKHLFLKKHLLNKTEGL